MKRLFLLSLFVAASFSHLLAQNFLKGLVNYSKTTEAYLTLNDGTEYTGTIYNFEFEKGLIIKLKFKINGEKRQFNSSEIKSLYIPSFGLEEMISNASEEINIIEWNDDYSIHAPFIKSGYEYYESSEVILKNKKVIVLLQLINPGFANGIKVYSDPLSRRTFSAKVKGYIVAGGFLKSYYFKKGNEAAFKLSKDNLKENRQRLFGDCPELFEKYGKDLSWFDIEKLVFFYSENCNKI